MGLVLAFALIFCGCFPWFLDAFLLSSPVSYFFGSPCFCLRFSCMLASLLHWLLCFVFLGLLFGFVLGFMGVLSLCLCLCGNFTWMGFLIVVGGFCSFSICIWFVWLLLLYLACGGVCV